MTFDSATATLLARHVQLTPRRRYGRAVHRSRRARSLPSQEARWYTKAMSQWSYAEGRVTAIDVAASTITVTFG